MSEPSLQLKAFEQFEAFAALSADDLMVLAEHSSIEAIRKRETLFDSGNDDPWIYCLMEGTVQLTAPDGRALRIDAGTKAAHQPLARLKPRMYTAEALTPVRVLRIDGTDLGDWQSYLFTHPEAGGRGMSVEVVDAGIELSVDDDGTFSEKSTTLQKVEYNLPSLPAVALDAMRIVDSEDCDANTLARVLVNDPPIAAKLIKAANSPVFYGRDSIGNCHRAVVRLGLRTTRQLVVSFAMRDLFNCPVPEIQLELEQLWSHSAEVAAIAFTLADRIKGFNRDDAQLAGLLHDIGVLSVLSSASGEIDDTLDIQSLRESAHNARAEIGAEILEAWNFPSEQTLAVRDAEQWWRDDNEQAELADLIMVSQLLSFIGKPGFLDVPPLTCLPAFRKLFPDHGSPELVMELLQDAKEQAQQIKALLNT